MSKSLTWCVQAYEAGVQSERQEVHQQRLLNQKLERALQGKVSQQQTAADKEATAAVQAAAHVTSLQDTILQLKVTPNLYCQCCYLAHDTIFCLFIIFEEFSRVHIVTYYWKSSSYATTVAIGTRV